MSDSNRNPRASFTIIDELIMQVLNGEMCAWILIIYVAIGTRGQASERSRDVVQILNGEFSA